MRSRQRARPGKGGPIPNSRPPLPPASRAPASPRPRRCCRLVGGGSGRGRPAAAGVQSTLAKPPHPRSATYVAAPPPPLSGPPPSGAPATGCPPAWSSIISHEECQVHGRYRLGATRRGEQGGGRRGAPARRPQPAGAPPKGCWQWRRERRRRRWPRQERPAQARRRRGGVQRRGGRWCGNPARRATKLDTTRGGGAGAGRRGRHTERPPALGASTVHGGRPTPSLVTEIATQAYATPKCDNSGGAQVGPDGTVLGGCA